MTKETRNLSSARIINKQDRPATKVKTREMTVEEATQSARKTSKRYKAALKELARR